MLFGRGECKSTPPPPGDELLRASTHSRKGRRAVESCTRKTFSIEDACCIGPISIVRSERGAYSLHTRPKPRKRPAFPRFAPLTRHKWWQGRRWRRVIRIHVAESMFIEMGGVTPRRCRCSNWFPAAPESESQAATGSSTGDRQAGSTGATGETSARCRPRPATTKNTRGPWTRYWPAKWL